MMPVLRMYRECDELSSGSPAEQREAVLPTSMIANAWSILKTIGFSSLNT